MKKKVLREIRRIANEVLGEEQTEKIINETVKEVLEETKPKKLFKRTNKKVEA